jgi:hypothetical protein
MFFDNSSKLCPSRSVLAGLRQIVRARAGASRGRSSDSARRARRGENAKNENFCPRQPIRGLGVSRARRQRGAAKFGDSAVVSWDPYGDRKTAKSLAQRRATVATPATRTTGNLSPSRAHRKSQPSAPPRTSGTRYKVGKARIHLFERFSCICRRVLSSRL